MKGRASVILAIVAVAMAAALASLPAAALADEGDLEAGELSAQAVTSGTAGTCKWELDSSGVLTVHPGEYGELKLTGYENAVKKVVFKTEGGKRVVLRHSEEPWRPHPMESLITSPRLCLNQFNNMKAVDLSGLDTSNVTSMRYMFCYCSSLTSIDISGLDTSNVTDMEALFWGCSSLTSIDISGLDTSNVTDMSYLFWGCSSLTSIDISGLDTSNVTDMTCMFDCPSLSSLDLSGLDTSNVRSMAIMFSGCSSLASLDLSGFNTSNVTNMESMFGRCSSLTSINLSGLDTSKVLNMDGMFAGCSSLPSLDLSRLDTANVTNMSEMFAGCSSLQLLDLSMNNVSSVNKVSGMFYMCSSLRTVIVPRGLLIDCLPGTWKGPQGKTLSGSSFENNYVPGTMFGKWTRVFDMSKINVSFAEDSFNNSFNESTYTGKSYRPVVVVEESYSGESNYTKLVEGVEYRVEYKDNVNAGTAKAIVTGIGAASGVKTLGFTISRADISNAAVSGLGNVTYSGRAAEPKLVVELGGIVLKEGSDYTLLYSNNNEPGTAYVVINGKGNYEGSCSREFVIKPMKTAPTEWKRLYGNNALDTMRAIVREGFSGTGGTVVVATFDGYWDALAASGLAGLSGAPVLMTDGAELSAQAAYELQRLSPSQVFVCGGTAAVSDGVCSDIQTACGVAPRRIAGENAVDTAVQIDRAAPSATGGEWSGEAFLCTSDGYWDALAAAPVAYAKHMPIFLTESDGSLSESTLQAIRDCGISKVHIAGGTAAVSGSAEGMLGDLAGNRFAGANAVETSELVARFGLERGMTANCMGVATTDGYWDALAGAALCGKKGSVLVLASDPSSSSIDGFVGQNSASEVSAYVFGGPAAVGDDVVGRLESVTAAY